MSDDKAINNDISCLNNDVAYEWDETRNAWFPKIDDAFLANYQMNYGSTPCVISETPEEQNKIKPKIKTNDVSNKKKHKETKPDSWFDLDNEKNCYIYVSGLPTDTNEQEFAEYFSKCGIIMKDEYGKPKIKLYKDSNGNLKGDARCCFLRKESVDLAINLLDESSLRNNLIKVEKAVFTQKGDYKRELKPKKKRNKKIIEEKQNKVLDWVERGEKKSKNQYIVVFHNFYDPKQCQDSLDGLKEIKSSLTAMCQNYGDIKKIMIFDRHAEAVCSCAFRSTESADNCVKALNGTILKGKILKAQIWDGTTDYNIIETPEEYNKRIKQWEEYLEQ